jgi:two-component system cell cycle response regulator
MTARILVVDDVPANRKLLEARLRAEYFEVITAENGSEALEACENGKIDLVLLDVMMPGIDGFEVCRRLKVDAATAHIPVVLVTALDGKADRIQGLDAGADDFLTKPVNDLQLMTRVKSLVRLKSLTDELRLRAATTRNIGLEEILNGTQLGQEKPGRVLLIDDRDSSRNRFLQLATGEFQVDLVGEMVGVMLQAAEGNYDAILVSTAVAGVDPLRLCSQLRAIDRTRFVPIVLLADQGDEERIAKAMELGVNDYMTRPLDREEMLARLRTQVKRKRYNEQLRISVTRTIEMAVIDGLTGLHNRRYLDNHLQTLVDRAKTRRRPLSMVMIDLDHFKRINDTFGHIAGDAVLKEAARRIRRNVRGIDLACRYGGEEFAVVMPETDGTTAAMVAERIRTQIGNLPIDANGTLLPITASFGVSQLDWSADTLDGLVDRADQALYRAKKDGRNQVVYDGLADAMFANGIGRLR